MLTRAVDIYPFYAPIWVDLGNAHGAGGRMAERSFRRAIEINPGSEFANFGLGQVLVKGRRLAEARPYMVKAVSLAPRLADARFMLGNIYMAAGETVQAVGQFKAALSILPREPRIHHNLALAYLGQGDRAKGGSARA